MPLADRLSPALRPWRELVPAIIVCSIAENNDLYNDDRQCDGKLREQFSRIFAKSLPGRHAITARSTLGHIDNIFIPKDGEQLVHISAVVCLPEFGFRNVDLVNVVHPCWPLKSVLVGAPLT